MIRNLIDVRKLIDRYVGIPLLFSLRLQNFCSGRPKADILPDEKVSKVLVIYLSGIGDTVMILSCLKHIREHYPDAEISILASSQNYEIVKANPYASKIFHLDTTRGMSGFMGTFVSITRELRRIGYDIIIDFEQFLRLSALICSLSKGKKKVGFRTTHQHRHYAYTNTLSYDSSIHTLDNFLGLLNLLGINNKPKELEEIYVSEEDRSVVTSLIQENNIVDTDVLIGIHPGSGNTGISRRWEPCRFSAIANLLIKHYNAKIIFTGTKDEEWLIESILFGIDYSTNCYNFAGKVTLGQLPFLLGRFHAYLSNDTGPLHIAAAMNVAVVALFGPNTPVRYGPLGNGHCVINRGLACSPCILAHEGKVPYCRNNRCMQEISVDEVWKALERVIKPRIPHFITSNAPKSLSH
ncbi:MAG: glycosyltransferase family 9 protein [bacterium]